MRASNQFSRSLALLSLTVLPVFQAGCSDDPDPQIKKVFAEQAPVGDSYKREVSYLKKSGQLRNTELHRIEKDIAQSETRFGVPKALLWCLLFQESRFDLFRDALREHSAHGIGQFTSSALDEINLDTDQYFRDSSQIFKSVMRPESLPISFRLVRVPEDGIPKDRKERRMPEQPKNSYFQTDSAVTASAAYITNRYYQIKRSVEKYNLDYNPDVIWIFAAAAYNKGPRAILAILSDQREMHGDRALTSILKNPVKARALMENNKVIDKSLRRIWRHARRENYVEEMKRNMAAISDCSFAKDQM